MNKLILLCGVVAIAAVILVALVTTPLLTVFGSGSSSTVISRSQSGLLTYNPLSDNSTSGHAVNNSLQFGGNAPSQDASYTVVEDSSYLHIGVKAPANGSWAGYYAVTPEAYATTAHAVLEAPAAPINGYFTNGLYVQAADEVLNYVTCVSVTNSTGTYWMVVHAYQVGSAPGAMNTYDYLWREAGNNQPMVRDCVIVTNGQNSLEVYLDHVLVYQSQSLSLGMHEPFNFFVGVESEYAGQLTYGSARDFYVTSSDQVQVIDLPSSVASVEIVGSSGTVVATAPVQSGKAIFTVAQDSLPISGYIKALNKGSLTSNATAMAWTPNLMDIYGGDVYSLGANPSTTSQLTIDSMDTNGNELNGYYVTLMKDGVNVGADYLPTAFNLENGQTYTLLVSDYGNYVFDHWSDGSTSRIMTISISNNTEISAIFRNANSPPPQGDSIISVTAVDSSGQPMTGFYATLWQDGFLVSQAYSPASFVVPNNGSYQVSISNFGTNTFSHWTDGSTSSLHDISVGTGTEANLVAVYN